VKLIIERSNELDNESYAAGQTLLFAICRQATVEPQEEQREREKERKWIGALTEYITST
jgi:hypothetical protein